MASTSRGICGNSDASIDARSWTTVYHHNGTTFYGFSDNKPLTVLLTNQSARCVRIQLPGNDYLYLDEVEVFGRADAAKNLALHQPADQSSLSIWPRAHPLDAVADIDWPRRPEAPLSLCERLFAWCKYYPRLAAEPNKLDKANVPEDAFYHLFEMGIDGSGAHQLTHGKYDDFDGRYLPDGRVVFLSTRRGQFIQAGRESARETLTQPDLPDCYVRCGGGPERPVAVYTLHAMERDGTGLCAISPFEMFEWEPSVANDGSILCARWDYIDRDNMPFMSLWSTRPDGTGTRLVYKNLSRVPHCVFEPRSIPNSDKIVFTASGHHSQTMRGAS